MGCSHNGNFYENPSMRLLTTRYSFFKLTQIRIKIEVHFTTLLATGLSNGHVLIMPLMTRVIAVNDMASQKCLN
jgi:hypothetical protein